MDESDSDVKNGERYKRLGFKPQKEIVFNKFLPYADELDDESVRLFADIKGNLGRSMMLREYRPGFGIWISRLNKYLKVYGLKFSKEDHIALIKLLFEALTIPDLEPSRVYKIGNSLILLLKKSELISPEELELPWRKLYDLGVRITESNATTIGMYRYFSTLDQTITLLTELCKIYFPISATEEILAEYRPFLCPFTSSTMCDAIAALQLFLPVTPRPDDPERTHQKWLPEMMDLWKTCHNAPPWENNMMWIVARLAENNIGFIDWEPYIPIMFTRFLRSLDLPVMYKGVHNGKTTKIDIAPMSLWIVSILGNGSSAITYLRQFIHSIESYYHHANQGRWAIKLKNLLKKLPTSFVERVHRERYALKSWRAPIPDSHKLTEQDITDFVEALKPIVTNSVYSHNTEVMTALQNLALLRPNIIIPIVLDKLYMMLDSLTEPHKLTAAMQCLVALARPLVEGAKNNYPEGPTHVIPLLMSTLPGIDPNDIRKCLVTFQFISNFVSLIPLIDSSNASDHYSDLTEEEHIVCEASAQFEDFVLQFLDRAFALIESSSMELTRLEQPDVEKKSKLENVAESALTSICTSLLMQTSHSIFKSALRKLDSFIMARVLETKVSGALVAGMVRSFAKVRPDEVVKLFIPRLCNNILTSLKDIEDLKKEERLDNELLFNLLILSDIVLCQGKALLPYEEILIAVLDRTLWLTCREAAYSAHVTLSRILSSLSGISPCEYRSSPISYDLHIKDFLSIREWGKPGDLYDLNLTWRTPGKAEVDCIQRIVWRYLPNELKKLELYAASVPKQNINEESSDGDLQREELHRSLAVVCSLLSCKPVLPSWKESPIVSLETNISMSPMELNVGCPGVVDMPDGSNIRRTVAISMEKVQTKILTSAEGDTKSLFSLITIWNTLLLNKGNGDRGFEAHWKNYHSIKRLVEDKLRGRKRHIRCLLIDRIMLQHELRVEASVHELTETHLNIMKSLLKLAISSYSEVRSSAQSKLLCAIGHFPYSYTLLIPELKKILELDSNLNHEQFKGALYLLLGPKAVPLIARHDWNLVNQIWPTLVRSNLSEKPSVINLMDSLVDTIHKNFPTITIKLEIPNSCVQMAKTMWENVPIPQQAQATEEEVQAGIVKLKQTGEKNLSIYNDAIKQLMDAIEFGNLHWRYHLMALSLLRDLVHPDVKYNSRVIQCFLRTLNHDSLDLRKIVLRCVLYVLKQQKREHKKVLIDPYSFSSCVLNPKPGDRHDNSWLQYNSKTRPLTDEEWNKLRYVHKAHIGYYAWPQELLVYAPSNEQPKLDRTELEMNQDELVVYSFFMNEDNVSKLIKYLSLEEKKGKDKFNGFRFVMFKNLFRNHGDAHLQIFLPHLKRLVSDKEEQHQRCAAEIIAALIRGSKHWPFEMVSNMWQNLTPIIRTALANTTVETMQDWGICFATASEGRDPNRNHWLYELLMEDPLRDEASFIECGRMYALQGALNQQEWRVAELLHRLWTYFRNFMTHPFQNVRERLSSILSNVTETDVLFPGGNKTISPRIEDVMNEVEPKLAMLYKSGLKDFNHVKNENLESDVTKMIDKITLSDEDKDCALRLMKTVFKWIVSVLSRVQYSTVVPYYKIFSLACSLQSYEHDEEVEKMCTQVLAMLSQALHPLEEIPLALKYIRAVVEPSPLWSARVAAAKFLQSFVFHNMSLMISKDIYVEEVKQIVLILLQDEALEVRQVAGQVLSGLLHVHFLQNIEQLLIEFKLKSKTKLPKKVHSLSNTGNSSITDSKYAEAVRERHTAVQGMCSFIDAHPYDVPPYMADIFQMLGAHLNDPEPIPSTIRKTLGNFKRTHHDNWETHKLKFTEEELGILNDLSVPPSYYA